VFKQLHLSWFKYTQAKLQIEKGPSRSNFGVVPAEPHINFQ